MKITKAKLKQIIKEELSGVMEGAYDFDISKAAEISNQEASVGYYAADSEEDMGAYLIEKGVYKALPDGGIAIFTGNVQSAREALEASGKFNQKAIDYYIDSLHRQIR